jgi:hypothetical protein
MTMHTAIPPFWERLPSIALYPFRGSALATLVVLGTLMGVASLIPLIGWLIVLVLWLSAFKQAFEMLIATANGRSEPPIVSLEASTDIVWGYLSLQFLCLIAPLMAKDFGGEGAEYVTSVIVGLLLPAATIGLAISDSLRRALNPIHLVLVMARIGWPYVALVGLALVIDRTASRAQYYFSEWMPQAVADALGATLSLWALFATFHLMGYLVWQYHEALGFRPEGPLPRGGLASVRDQEALRHAEAMIADGHLEAAIGFLRQEVSERAVCDEMHQLYRRALKLKGDSKLLLRHAHDYLQLLILSKDERKALSLIRETLPTDPDFSPYEIEDTERLASAAIRSSQDDVGLSLLASLLKSHEGHRNYAAWALSASDIVIRRGAGSYPAKTWLERAITHAESEQQQKMVEKQLKALSLNDPTR